MLILTTVKDFKHRSDEQESQLAWLRDEHRKDEEEFQRKLSELEITLTQLENEMSSSANDQTKERETASEALKATQSLFDESRRELQAIIEGLKLEVVVVRNERSVSTAVR